MVSPSDGDGDGVSEVGGQMEPSGIQKSPSQQPSCVPMSQLDRIVKINVNEVMLGFFSPDVRGWTLRRQWRVAHSWTIRSLRHAVISQPAALGRCPHVAHHFSLQALGGSGGVAGGRTDRTLGHAQVSQPAVSV